MRRIGLSVVVLVLAGLMTGPVQAAAETLFTTSASAATLATAVHGRASFRGHYGYGRRARIAVHRGYGHHGYYRGGGYMVGRIYRDYPYTVYRPYGYRSYWNGYGPVYPRGVYYGYPRSMGYYGYPGWGYSFSFGY